MNFKRRSAYVKLPDPSKDCPRKNCDGWLSLYGTPTDTGLKPVYFQCSNRANPDDSFRCKQRVIFSHHPGTCSVCDESINLQDVITTDWNQQWIHLRCSHRSVQPVTVFAVCLRCTTNIANASDAEPANLGGIDGYLHVSCTPKKRKLLLAGAASDSEFASSQESV